ncbi:hypothetical protein H310_13751 [Aphanomyces invadans]|uniref:Uncharacterized protein n=1 Tax=Aphanomyces invadans TaxID=157072 RepID=A0A024TCD8_9STRA|nr:hypothetical protein H310_13751 [Aphanomyces invadans]ETV91674.1 hypothetical protein H310_13751 [Aphanomyces invadans]|eukprot:XP_008879600.1 hypothetical protein H310_13751 [Aphanomyces invadans]
MLGRSLRCVGVRTFSSNAASSAGIIELIKQGQADVALDALEDASSSRPDDWDITDAYGSTALTLASRGGHLSLCRAILPHVTSSVLNQANMFGSTALMCASASGHGEVCKVLLAAGADVNIKTRYGSTALSKAAEAGHASIVDQLLAHGADASPNVMGKTPWDLAAEKGHAILPPTDVSTPSQSNAVDDQELDTTPARVTRILSPMHVECELPDGFTVVVTKPDNVMVPVRGQKPTGEATLPASSALL